MSFPRLNGLIEDWVKKQNLVAGKLVAGKHVNISVLHDDECDFINQKGDCTCNPLFIREQRPIGKRVLFRST